MMASSSLDTEHFVRNASSDQTWAVAAAAPRLLVLVGAIVFVIARPGLAQAEAGATVRLAGPEGVAVASSARPGRIDREAVARDERAEFAGCQQGAHVALTEAGPEHPAFDGGDLGAPGNGHTAGTTSRAQARAGAQGPAGSGRPPPFAGRNPGQGLRKGIDGGPTAETEKAVLAGVRWLLRHQNDDGSWGANTLRTHCPAKDPCYDPKVVFGAHYNEGLTGLVLLALMGAGLGPESQVEIDDLVHGKPHKAGPAVKSGLQWLVDRQNEDGSFSRNRAFMYNEALAGAALAEAHRLSPAGQWKEPAQKAMDFIMAAQRTSPHGEGLWGWRYASRADLVRDLTGANSKATRETLHDADTSITGWCIMALNAGRLARLEVKWEHLDGGLAFAKWATGDNGLVGYVDPKGAGQAVMGTNDHFVYHKATMSALGACIRMLAKRDVTDPFLELAAKQILADLPAIGKDKLSIDYYYWHCASLALNHIDGPDAPKRTGRYWGPWNKALVDALLELQDKNKRSHKSGGWIDGDRWSYTGGPLYTTAISLLTLEVYYR